MTNTNDSYNVAVELVDKNIEKGFGEKVSIYYRNEKINYIKLSEEINKFGESLKKLGVQIENRVMLLLKDCPHFFYSFFGAIKMGAVAVPANTLLRPGDYLYMLNDSRAKVIVVNADLVHLIDPIVNEAKYLEQVIVVGGESKKFLNYEELTKGQSTKLEPAETCRDDSALWLYSSGTTGTPKGIVHLHHDMVFSADAFAKEIIDLRPEDKVYSASKLFFAYGLGNSLFYPLRVGAATVLSPDRPDPKVVLDTIQKYKPTVFFSVPTIYAALLQATRAENADAFSEVRICISSGEALSEIIFSRWKERFGVEITEGLGCSEIMNTFIANRPGESIPGCAGKVIPGYEIKLVDEEGKPVPRGEVGTLHVKGDSLAAYYWNQHEKTKESFLGHWFNTKDRFYQDDSDRLWYVGRADEMIKAGGIWVAPLEVEKTLLQHQAVLECAVIGSKDESNLIKPKAFVVLKDGYKASEQLEREIKDFVKNKIAHYKYPRWVQFISELPKTTTGKIKRLELASLERGTKEVG